MMVTPNGQPETDVEVGQTDQPAGAARLRNLVLPRGKGPTVGFETPLNTTLDVEVPLIEPALEAEGLHRAISTLHPDCVLAVAASQMPSQSGLSCSPPGLINPS